MSHGVVGGGVVCAVEAEAVVVVCDEGVGDGAGCGFVELDGDGGVDDVLVAYCDVGAVDEEDLSCGLFDGLVCFLIEVDQGFVVDGVAGDDGSVDGVVGDEEAAMRQRVVDDEGVGAVGEVDAVLVVEDRVAGDGVVISFDVEVAVSDGIIGDNVVVACDADSVTWCVDDVVAEGVVVGVDADAFAAAVRVDGEPAHGRAVCEDVDGEGEVAAEHGCVLVFTKQGDSVVEDDKFVVDAAVDEHGVSVGCVFDGRLDFRVVSRSCASDVEPGASREGQGR